MGKRQRFIEGAKIGLAVAAFVVVAVLVGIRTIDNLNIPGDTDPVRFGMADFRDVIYFPIQALIQGVNPYDVAAYKAAYPVFHPFPPYSPLTLLVHLPFGLLPYEVSEVSYFLFSLGVMLGLSAAILASCRLEIRVARVFGLAAGMIVSRPGYSTLVLGQSTMLVVLGTVLALNFASSRPCLAGLSLGLATLKPQYGVPLAILMLVRGDFRAVLTGFGVGAVGVALPVGAILASSDGGYRGFISRVSGSYAAFEDGGLFATAGAVLRIDFSSVLERILGSPVPLPVALMITAGIITFGGLGVWHAKFGREGEGADSLSGVIILLTVLISVYHGSYDTMALWVPLVAVVFGSRAVWRQAPMILRLPLAAVLAFPLVNYLATYAVINRLGLTGWAWTVVVSLNALCVLTALLLTLYLTYATHRAQASD